MLKKEIFLSIILLASVSIAHTGEVLQKKLAFLQGLHRRAGARSTVWTLPFPAIQKILGYVPHTRFVQIENAAKPLFIVKISDISKHNNSRSPCVWQGKLSGTYCSSLDIIPRRIWTSLQITPLRISVYDRVNRYCGTVYLTSDQINQVNQITLNYRLAGITITYQNRPQDILRLENRKS